ncbi:hypothetical protein, partial [Kaarinaea lacus]
MLHDNHIRLSIIFLLLLFLAACGGGSSGGNAGSTANFSSDESNSLNEEQKATDCPENSCFYFSYDDSASTAAVELTKYAINNGQIPDESLGRAYEFLNFEQFNGSSLTNIGLFDVSMGIWTHPGDNESGVLVHELGIYLSSPTITKEDRPNAVLTLLVDVSGSMESSYLDSYIEQEATIRTRLDIAKYGLTQLYHHSLKEGDVINIV